MTVLRHYLLKAAPDKIADIKVALASLAAAVRPLHGCTGVELFQDQDAPEQFFFIEHWASREDHKAAGKALGKDAFAPVAACIVEPPVGRYLEGGEVVIPAF